MSEAFSKILREHLERYPRMAPQDCVKLAYQNALGPGHAAPDRGTALRELLREWGGVSDDSAPRPPEAIGNGLCRLYLAETDNLPLAAPLLTDLFRMTAREFHGQAADLEENLSVLGTVDLPGMAEFLAAYRQQGCPAVRHSDQYRQSYQPHYRLLRSDFAGFFPALVRIATLTERGGPVLAAVDGRCGSGKSSLGELVRNLFPCTVVHMDDFYLPPNQRDKDWEKIPGGNIDFARLLQEVLVPAGAGEPIHYRPFRCSSGTLGEETLLPARPLTVVEGSYSQHPLLTARYDLKIFLTCGPETQRRRLERREGAHFSDYESRWMPMEERYFRQCGTEQNCDLGIDTTDFF